MSQPKPAWSWGLFAVFFAPLIWVLHEISYRILVPRGAHVTGWWFWSWVAIASALATAFVVMIRWSHVKRAWNAIDVEEEAQTQADNAVILNRQRVGTSRHDNMYRGGR